MNAIRFFSDLLATYRLTRLVLEDEITAPLRDAVFDRFPPHENKFSYLLTCSWCSSVWAGLAIFTLRRYAPETLSDILSGSLAGSALTGLAYERF